MVTTDEEWSWNAIKDLVKHLDLQVNDVKQMWAEIDTDEDVLEADRVLREICQMEIDKSKGASKTEADFKKDMPELYREMRFGN